ncbi:Putative PPPDE peptidase domain, armadillo-like helical, PUL domain, Thioredoxin [Septoria linicola]|uniref:PPPDE peptidase domain, armadillo-like helical, PUL domain, Thioredoxin n=1 Tax=Septoria linicola TaxID=215465 RepID=A0A9Q9AKZ5_9PEZI|nr:putative PPPDE peptidase domain, armadillo-like helical, PUL domain, Thioredoxin [Septoria linicola]USW49899.1 Putative PPPDE peptidase domain, armadillo-like helical, PUL domain, Thioredoxin [Septoria linicola]
MNVELYVYDLTRGMARSMSRQFLGIQIDAVYHTALVFDNIEYFFGQGVQTCYPGTTHHGQPMEKISLGKTELPLETILDYLESLKEVYTAESYDLFAHNCNNFTNDFAMFLVGRGIPEHITSLPAKVLETPFGQMLKPQIDASMRQITQAPVPPQNRPCTKGSNASKVASSAAISKQGSGGHVQTTNGTNHQSSDRYGSVVNLTDSSALDTHLAGAADSCTTIFFTSSTCGPCRLAYPMFDRLAEQYPQALFVKVDINSAREISSRYQIRATPTFMTISKGVKHDEWTGADPNLLKSNVELLVETTFPPHRHLTLKVPTLQYASMKPYVFGKMPPLEKLVGKLGSSATNEDISSLREFVDKRNKNLQDAAVPDLQRISNNFRTTVLQLPLEVRFAAVDLLRCAMVDARVSGFFAEETQPGTITSLVQHVNTVQDCPHNLRLVTLHLSCNVFSSNLSVKELMTSEDTSIFGFIQLITSSLLDASHPTTRVAAGSLAFNLAVSNYRIRREQKEEALAEGEQVELAASILETLVEEQSEDAAKVLLLAFGYLVYCAPEDGELADLCKAMGARKTVRGVKTQQRLADEIASLLW